MNMWMSRPYESGRIETKHRTQSWLDTRTVWRKWLPWINF